VFSCGLVASAVAFYSAWPGSIPGRGACGCLGSRRRLSTGVNCVDSRRLHPGGHFFLSPICVSYFFSLATFCYFHLFRASLTVSAVVFHSTGPGSIPGRGARGCLGTRRRLSTDINCVDSRRLYPGSHFFHLTPICLWYFF
jgi:hypothetical protein